MKRSIKSLVGYSLSALDGEIGKVKEFYFDDSTWTIRYLIVKTGAWLSGREVLISPAALLAPDWTNKTFPVTLMKEQVKNSPDINTDLPVSRQEEIKLNTYYPWVAYWEPGYFAGMGNPVTIPMMESIGLAPPEKDYGDKHLRSTAAVTGYSVQANDGAIGDIEDFLIDDVSWKIDFMIIDTGHWMPGKKVLLASALIKAIDWSGNRITINSTVAHVKASPAYDPTQEMTEFYTLALDEHYNTLII